jgi:hypothetical protein
VASQYYLNFSPSTPVATLTTLMPFLRIDPYVCVSVVLRNLSATDNVNLIVDPSVGGVVPNISKRYMASAGPGEECSIDFTPPMFARYLRVSAQTDGPAFPTAQVSWALLGKTPQTP